MAHVALQRLVEEAGVTELRIRTIIEAFYTSVREHDTLAPVFTSVLGTGDWNEHTNKIIQFWTTAFRLDRTYHARDFMPAHMRHHQISADLIPHWLALFDQTLEQQCTANEADAFRGIAQAMMDNLALGFAKRDD